MSDLIGQVDSLHRAFSAFDDERKRRASIREVQDDLLRVYQNSTARAAKSTSHAEYCNLQATWNQQVLELSSRLVLDGTIGRDRMLSIGSFLGLLEISYANVFTDVICVDQADFLVPFRPDNVMFHRADLDTAEWTLPEGRFNVCFMVEILEHLLWSPVALLKWIQAHCDMLVITTPDDLEWPAMAIRPYTRYQHFSAIPSAAEGVRGNPDPMSHCKQYSQAEFIELLNFCGFRILEFHRVGDGSHQMLAICTPRGR